MACTASRAVFACACLHARAACACRCACGRSTSRHSSQKSKSTAAPSPESKGSSKPREELRHPLTRIAYPRSIPCPISLSPKTPSPARFPTSSSPPHRPRPGPHYADSGLARSGQEPVKVGLVLMESSLGVNWGRAIDARALGRVRLDDGSHRPAQIPAFPNPRLSPPPGFPPSQPDTVSNDQQQQQQQPTTFRHLTTSDIPTKLAKDILHH